MRIPICISLLLLSFTASGHHSLNEFDREVTTEIEGEVVGVFWRNPHVRFSVRDDSTQEVWVVEGPDLNSVTRQGLKQDTLQEGERIKVFGSPSRRRNQFMTVNRTILADGTEIFGRPPRLDAGGAESEERQSSTDDGANREYLFRVWTRAGLRVDVEIDELPLTASARTAYDAYDPLRDDPAVQCVPSGMPKIMTWFGPHPIEFEKSGDDIVLRLETFDSVRVIRMDEDASDAGEPPTALMGHSVGSWDGNTLVVTTTRIDWPYHYHLFNLHGIPQSETAKVVERFTVDKDRNELVYDIQITDPDAFTDPLDLEEYIVFNWRPDTEIQPYECAVDERWSVDLVD